MEPFCVASACRAVGPVKRSRFVFDIILVFLFDTDIQIVRVEDNTVRYNMCQWLGRGY